MTAEIVTIKPADGNARVRALHDELWRVIFENESFTGMSLGECLGALEVLKHNLLEL